MSKLLSIDPSITSTGYAVFYGDNQIVCGWIRPKRTHTRNGNRITMPAHERIESLIQELCLIQHEHRPCEAVVEITSGKVSGRHKGGGAGLGTHGMATGHVARWAIDSIPFVTQVYENEWTRGRGKEKRRLYAHARYPSVYTDDLMKKDKGGDISDAIALGLWHLDRERTIEPDTGGKDTA